MQLIQPSENFGFNYEAWDQADDLNVMFSIYDTSSGVPLLIDTVASIYAGFGSYVGTYVAAPGIQYLVAGIVYTDNTFTTVDTSRAPYSIVYQTFGGISLKLGFTYTTYDFASNLDIRSMIYNSSSGTPILQDTVNLVYVDFGIYFGSFLGAVSENFQIIGVVYTDNTYTTPNYNYAPSSISFSCIDSSPVPPALTGSALIDITDLLHDPDFVEAMSLITRVPTVNTLGENIISETTLNSIGSVQPTSGKDLLRLPEALRLLDVFTFWFQGEITATAPGKYPMILVFKGKRYQVQKVLDWTSWGRSWSQGLAIAELPS